MTIQHGVKQYASATTKALHTFIFWRRYYSIGTKPLKLAVQAVSAVIYAVDVNDVIAWRSLSFGGYILTPIVNLKASFVSQIATDHKVRIAYEQREQVSSNR
jgi:hypothetical protein